MGGTGGRRDYGTTRLRDYGTTGLRDHATTGLRDYGRLPLGAWRLPLRGWRSELFEIFGQELSDFLEPANVCGIDCHQSLMGFDAGAGDFLAAGVGAWIRAGFGSFGQD